MGALERYRQPLTVTLLLVLAGAGVWVLAQQARTRVVRIGFWFEDVTFDAAAVEADRLGGGITAGEMAVIEAVAIDEVRAAFSGFRIAVSGDRDATYKVRVVQDLRHPLFPRGFSPAGESRGIWPLGGSGAVNFRVLASNAIAHAPPAADRAAKIEGIGRGIGRAAVHEFAHQMMGSRDIHHGRDVQSYEYWNADRREQYYGPMRWDVAAPVLARRIGAN